MLFPPVLAILVGVQNFLYGFNLHSPVPNEVGHHGMGLLVILVFPCRFFIIVLEFSPKFCTLITENWVLPFFGFSFHYFNIFQ